MASFTRMMTVFLFVYGFELVYFFSGIFTVMEGEGKEFAAYFEDDNFEFAPLQNGYVTVSCYIANSHSVMLKR